MIVHGIPGPYRLEDGDIISIDVGVTLDGWVADAARTFAVRGDQPGRAQNLLAATEESLHAGVAQCRDGNRMGDVSSAIQQVAEERRAVGRALARRPRRRARACTRTRRCPTTASPGKGPLLEEGMVLAIEPMTTAGAPGVRVGGDGWAIYSQDGSPAAHFEFTVAITAAGPRILTPWHLVLADARTGAPIAAAAIASGGLRRCYHLESCPGALVFCLREGMSSTR